MRNYFLTTYFFFCVFPASIPIISLFPLTLAVTFYPCFHVGEKFIQNVYFWLSFNIFTSTTGLCLAITLHSPKTQNKVPLYIFSTLKQVYQNFHQRYNLIICYHQISRDKKSIILKFLREKGERMVCARYCTPNVPMNN